MGMWRDYALLSLAKRPSSGRSVTKPCWTLRYASSLLACSPPSPSILAIVHLSIGYSDNKFPNFHPKNIQNRSVEAPRATSQRIGKCLLVPFTRYNHLHNTQFLFVDYGFKISASTRHLYFYDKAVRDIGRGPSDETVHAGSV